MKKLNAEEAKQHLIIKGRSTRLTQHLSTLTVGEAIIIERGKDWVGKRPPYRIIHHFAEKTGWKFSMGRTVDNSGWIAKRLS
jgi:hypothetical protein